MLKDPADLNKDNIDVIMKTLDKVDTKAGRLWRYETPSMLWGSSQAEKIADHFSREIMDEKFTERPEDTDQVE